MRKIFQYTGAICLLVTLFAADSCQKRDIRGEQLTLQTVQLSMLSENGQYVVPMDSNFSKSNGSVTIPMTITFSDAAPKRFNVNVSVNDDTVKNLIASGKLPNTVLLPSGFYTMPSNVDVRFGLDHVDFNVTVDITAIERNFGKDLALAVSIASPTKGNQVAAGKKTAILIIHTDQVLTRSEIHYIYFAAAGSPLNIPQPGQIYNQNTSYLTVPVKISLAGEAGQAFRVKVNPNVDSVQRLLDGGTLPGTVLLKPQDDYTIEDTIVSFDANKNLATVNVDVNISSLRNNFSGKVALGLTLSDPTGHLLDSVRKNIVVVLDPPNLLESDITNDGSVLSVQYENTHADDQGENSTHVIDNDIGTKFLIFDFKAPAWIQLKYPDQRQAGAYTLTSANDAPGRDPKDWQILGSDDGVNWVLLDTRTNESFPNRHQTKKYTFSNKVPYSYYRFNILANNGDGLFQLAEWRLIKRP